MRRFLVTIIMMLMASTSSADTEAKIPTLINEFKQPELYCLAQNIYFEAGTESYMGKVAVAIVTLNRVRDTRFPTTVCEVVKQGPIRESWRTRQDANLPEDLREFYPVKNRCQFSWYCDGKGDDPVFGKGWRQSQEIAILTYILGQHRGLLEGATHYHADYVDPSWNKTKTLITQIDRHIFYRWD